MNKPLSKIENIKPFEPIHSKSRWIRVGHPVVLTIATAVFIIPIILAIYISAVSRPKYEAIGALIISPTGASRAISANSDDRSTPPQVTYDLVVKAQISIILSEDVIRAAIKDIGIGVLYPDLNTQGGVEAVYEQASLRARSNLTVSPENNGFVVRIGFKDYSSINSSRFVNELMSEYIKKRSSLALNGDAEEFYKEQAKIYERQFSEESAKLSKFSKQHTLWDATEQKKLLLGKRDDDAKSLQHTEGEISKKEAEADSIRQGISALRLRTALPPEIYGTTQLNSEVKPLKKGDDFSGDPPLINIKIYQQLSSALVDRNFELAGLKQLRARQVEAIQKSDKELQDLSDAEPIFSSLQRSVNQTQYYINALNKSGVDARVNNLWSSGEASSGIRILQAAVSPTTPYFPRPKLFISLGIASGAACAICFLYAIYLAGLIRWGAASNQKN